MRATEILSSEHRVIEQILTALETGAWLLSIEASFQPGFFLETADFITGFADGYHHKKEEGILFKMMLQNGMPREGSPVAAMLHEHEVARAYTRALRAAAERLKVGDPSARPEVIYNARHYAALLRNHIGMEDQIVFPLANELIPPELQDDMRKNFERFEHEAAGEGIPARYLAKVDNLEKEVDL
jgi:hemerythrin-like domain-containing protein